MVAHHRVRMQHPSRRFASLERSGFSSCFGCCHDTSSARLLSRLIRQQCVPPQSRRYARVTVSATGCEPGIRRCQRKSPRRLLKAAQGLSLTSTTHNARDKRVVAAISGRRTQFDHGSVIGPISAGLRQKRPRRPGGHFGGHPLRPRPIHSPLKHPVSPRRGAGLLRPLPTAPRARPSFGRATAGRDKIAPLRQRNLPRCGRN